MALTTAQHTPVVWYFTGYPEVVPEKSHFRYVPLPAGTALGNLPIIPSRELRIADENGVREELWRSASLQRTA
jgi:hypothetical protein